MKLGRKLKALLKDDSWDGCGISWLWGFPKEHPFHECCMVHDEIYVKHSLTLTRLEVDKAFLDCCLEKAGDSKKLQRQAKCWYRMTRATGWLWW